MKDYLIQLNLRMLSHFEKGEEIPAYLFLELSKLLEE